jgi:acetylornithine deacetylase/succinyl-diaminopimelate desuccinylase-like protein
MAREAPSDAELSRHAGIAESWGEPGYSSYERTTARPAVTINGITGGYAGPGAKAVIPSGARVKLDLRLVPDQDPEEIERLVRAHVQTVAPPTVRWRLRRTVSACPVTLDPRHRLFRLASQALHAAFGAPAAMLRSGGTIPVVSMLTGMLGIPTVLMGFALPDAHIHAPNERFHLPVFFRAIRASARFLDLVGGGYRP